MNTLIVPCSGKKNIGGLPVFLNRHPSDGSLLARKLLEGIFPEEYDRIIYSFDIQTEKKFEASETIRRFIPRAEVIILPEKTSGPAETVYETILRGNVRGKTAVKDSHNMISLEAPANGNMIAGLDLMNYAGTVENLRSKSFIVPNEQNDVLDIAEKRLRSDIISAGLYSFSDSEDFVSAFLRLSDPDYNIRELYVSHIISYLTGYRNVIFHCCNVSFFEDWASQGTWQELRRNFTLRVSGKRIRLIMTDLDGTLFDTVTANYLAYQEAMRPFGFNIDREYFSKHCNGRHYREFIPEIIGCNDDKILHEIHTAKKNSYEKYIEYVKINQPLMSLLNMCRDECNIALVTTASRRNTEDILKAFGLEKYFDLVMTREDITHNKPSPEGYIKAMEFFRASPEECLIFEDSPVGMEAARRSGITYFAVNM